MSEGHVETAGGTFTFQRTTADIFIHRQRWQRKHNANLNLELSWRQALRGLALSPGGFELQREGVVLINSLVLVVAYGNGIARK